MGVMGTVKHEVEGVELALRFWDAECRRNMSGNLMREIARGFERSETAKAMHPDKAKAFVDMTYTLSQGK